MKKAKDFTKNIMPKSRLKSFTVRDLILAQIILALIIGLVFLFINPAKKLEDIRIKTKVKDIDTLQTAINSYSEDHKGYLPQNFPAIEAPVEIKKNKGGMGDICSYLVPEYLPELPVNPGLTLVPVTNCSLDYITGYFISVGGNGELKVTSE